MIDAVLTSLIPKWLVNLLFRSFEAREAFLAQVRDLRKNHPERPIAFCLYNGGYIEYLAMRLFLLDEFGTDFDLKWATRLPSLYIEPFKLFIQRIASRLRVAPRPPSRIRFVSDDLKAGNPVLLNLETLDRKKAFQTPKGEIELAYLSQQNPDLLLVPVVFVWRKKRRLEEGENQDLSAMLWRNFKAPFTSPWNLLMGDPYQPRGLRKIFIMLRQYARSTLRLAEPLNLSDYNPKVLRRKILVTIQREKRVIIGPVYRSTRLISESILRSASFQRLVRTLAAEEGAAEISLLRRAEKYFHEISARFSYFTIEACGWFLHHVFTKIFDDVTVNDEDFERLRAASREGSLLFIPSHKSYVDFLLLSYLLFRKEILPPHIAAGINLNFWPVGSIFKRGGAFFIRRSFRGNILYAEVLKRYICELLANRLNVEFFIEGTRSRNGKLAPPKYGMLKMIIDGQVEGLIHEKVRVVPVSITYDRVTEERSHKRELEGGEKAKENAVNVIRSGKVLFRNYGKVHVRFADPVPLGEFVEATVGDGHDLDMRKLGVQKLAFEVCHRINGVTPVTSFGLVCAALLAKPGAASSRTDFERLLKKMHEDLVTLNVLMTPELQENFMEACRRAIARLVEDGIIKSYQTPLQSNGIKIAEKQRVAALYYKNSAIHALLPAGIAGLAKGDPERLLDLRSLLQFEFFFAEKDAFLRQVSHIPYGVMTDIYAFMLDDVLENITLGLAGLIKMQGLWMEAKEWKNRLMKFGQSMLLEANVSRLESVNTQSFGAFVEMAQNRGWLRESPQQPNLLTASPSTELNLALNRIKNLRVDPGEWDTLKEKYFAGDESTSPRELPN